MKNILYKYKTVIISFLEILAVAVFPVLLIYFYNADQISIVSILPILLFFAVIAVVIFIIFWLLIRSETKAAISCSLFMFMIANYVMFESLIKKVVPMLKFWHISIVLIVIIGHIIYLIYKKMTNEMACICCAVFCIVFCGLILFNGVIASPKIFQRRQTEINIRTAPPIVDKNLIISDLPNIYYIIMDEYSSSSFMEKYYSYDNSEFENYLKEKGFQISNTGHNSSFWTDVVMANILNLNYIANDLTTVSELNEYLQENLLFPLLQDKGYTLSGVGAVAFYGLTDQSSGMKSSQINTIDGKNIQDIILEKTIFYPVTLVANTQQRADTYMSQLQYLKNTDTYLNGGNFVIYHGLITHSPFVFQRNGLAYARLVTDWEDPKYYLDQFIYATEQLKDVIESLLEKDPDSIIIVQSDHSARGKLEFLAEDKTSFFNAVYYRGEILDIEGLSGVNTIRTILNRLFGSKYEMLPLP